MTTTTPFNAASLYGSMSRLANQGDEAHSAVKGAAGGLSDFGAMVKDELKSVVEQGNAAEVKQADLMAGKADLIDVVTAVSETELALETMVSVRDRVISAYEEIMRMPI
ncbi:MAG TPA: flagellar hook-basal body complex protein FliE [Methylomirabilota bacterium]|nr:flagellar hook-basal body complex protein FliE [Methylomirabilota bacterium]